MATTNCQINLATRDYTLQVNSVNLTGKSAEAEDPPSPVNPLNQTAEQPHPAEEEAFSWIRDTSNPRNGWKVKSSSLHYQQQGRGEITSQQYWIPKADYQPLPTPKHPQAISRPQQPRQRAPVMKWLPKNRSTLKVATPIQPSQQSHHKERRWIPKKTLRAQGYYQGNDQIWLPKSSLTPSNISTTPPTRITKSQPKPVSNPTSFTSNAKWVVKADYNKKKYKAPLNPPTIEATSLLALNEPSTSAQSSIPAKATLLQQLLQHAVSPDTVINFFRHQEFINHLSPTHAQTLHRVQRGDSIFPSP